MIIDVLFFAKLFNETFISFSVRVSKELVASSKIRIGGFFKRVLAMATLCFSPPESFKPLSPTTVLMPSGNVLISSLSFALLATSQISFSSAFIFP